eukprot:CAMPEP_0198527642 /NCGR_PEP_ID=MMETSP1462-20131121/24671_1 /TAXON_ID=1333877 /ORGANISM="Brandtodinium nutriculum, Strain RCC3387" /LENGTH=61 /DNA_ID=CAMNT_0044257453 /DNA_START=1 /DNA_END=186 /DNA_ORIENTATION=-
MRRPQHVVDVVEVLRRTPPLDAQGALDAVRSVHTTLDMWFCAADEADHGTSKDWRLPPREL